MSTPTNTTTHHPLNLRSLLEREKLNGTNLLDWFRQLRIVLKLEKKDYVLDGPVPEEPPSNASKAVKDARIKHVNDSIEVVCIILGTMMPDL